MVNSKWNAEINRYRNISFQWPNQNGHQNGIATNAITRIWSLDTCVKPQHTHLWVDRKMLACWSSGAALWIL